MDKAQAQITMSDDKEETMSEEQTITAQDEAQMNDGAYIIDDETDDIDVENSQQSEEQAPKKMTGPIKKGEVRNPRGRPKKIWTEKMLMDERIRKDLKKVARDHSPEAFYFLLETMRDDDVNMQHRLNAATQILDRGWGKPKQTKEITVSQFDSMSDEQLIKIIMGEEIEGELLGASPMLIESQDDDDE